MHLEHIDLHQHHITWEGMGAGVGRVHPWVQHLDLVAQAGAYPEEGRTCLCECGSVAVDAFVCISVHGRTGMYAHA
jgi:hypothetical protein